MRSYLCLGAITLCLVGCQASNPYQGERVPLPPAPAAAATHFDRSAYPAPTSTQHYTYWCWEHAGRATATQNSAHSILAEQLEQHGLRAASSSEQCELKVQLSSQLSERIRHDYDPYYPSVHYGVGYGHRRSYHDRYGYSGIGMQVPLTPRSYTEHQLQLTLNFTDNHSQTPVWRAQARVRSNAQGQASAEALRETFSAMLNDYR